MNPYLDAARNFTTAYQAQLQASDVMQRAAMPAEQKFDYVANTSTLPVYGAPEPSQAQDPLKTLNQFDTDMDTRVALVREELLNRAKQEVEDSRKRF